MSGRAAEGAAGESSGCILAGKGRFLGIWAVCHPHSWRFVLGDPGGKGPLTRGLTGTEAKFNVRATAAPAGQPSEPRGPCPRVRRVTRPIPSSTLIMNPSNTLNTE